MAKSEKFVNFRNLEELLRDQSRFTSPRVCLEGNWKVAGFVIHIEIWEMYLFKYIEKNELSWTKLSYFCCRWYIRLISYQFNIYANFDIHDIIYIYNAYCVYISTHIPCIYNILNETILFISKWSELFGTDFLLILLSFSFLSLETCV